MSHKGKQSDMKTRQEKINALVQFRDGLAKVNHLGYGNDECERAILVMFDDLVRHVVPRRMIHNYALSTDQSTCGELLVMATRVVDVVDTATAIRERKKGRAVVYPFVTTLGISGGTFLIAFHLAQLAPALFR